MYNNHYIGASVAFAFLLGVFIGFIIGRKSGHSDSAINWAMLLALLITFSYIFGSYYTLNQPSIFIVALFLSTGYGIKGGDILLGIIERWKK